MSLVKLLAAAKFAPDTPRFQSMRAQLHSRVSYMTESLQMAVILGAFCPCIDRTVQGVLRFETYFDHRFDHLLEDVLNCYRGALDPYEPGDTYPTQLVQRFQAYNEHAPWLVAVLTFLSEATTASGHWLCAVAREIFVLQFTYRNLRGCLVFEAPPRQPIAVD